MNYFIAIAVMMLLNNNLYSMEELKLITSCSPKEVGIILNLDAHSSPKQESEIPKISRSLDQLSFDPAAAENAIDSSPVHLAAAKNDVKKIIELLQANHSLWKTNKNGCYPICYAHINKSKEVIDILEIVRSSDFMSVEHVEEHEKKGDFFLPAITPAPDIAYGVISAAATKGNTQEVIRILVEQMGRVTPEFNDELHALYNNETLTESMQSIIKYTYPTRLQATFFAYLNPDYDPVTHDQLEELIDLNTNPNVTHNENKGYLHHIALNNTSGFNSLLPKLLAWKGINVNALYDSQWSPVCLMAYNNNHEGLALLLNHPECDASSLQTIDGNLHNALTLAILQESIECIELLLNHDIHTKTKLSEENSLLHLAVLYEKQKSLQTLLKRKIISLESRNEKGNTPLLEAAEVANLLAIKYLHDAGANKYATNNNGENMVTIAAQNNAPAQIVNFLNTFMQ